MDVIPVLSKSTIPIEPISSENSKTALNSVFSINKKTPSGKFSNVSVNSIDTKPLSLIKSDVFVGISGLF